MRLTIRSSLAALTLALCVLSHSAQAQSLTGVQSRKAHPLSTATFDLPINRNAVISGAVTFEPRDIGAGHSIVFQFDSAITQAGSATAVDAGNTGIGMASAVINPANSNEIIVTLTGIPDDRRVTVSLDNVNGNINPFAVSIGFRLGDSDNSGTLTLPDVSRVKARSGQAASTANFTYDVNTSGIVSAADIAAVKRRSRLFNSPPVVNAGGSQVITLPGTATLNGTAADDGLPDLPGVMTILWSRLSGPFTVTFGNATALSTSASFGGPGSYVLRLTASDGQLSGSSDVAMTVNPGPATALAVTGFTSPITAGTAGNATVTVRDALGNVATGYRGTVNFSSSDPLAVLPANYTFTAGDNGVHAFSLTLNSVGTQSITVTDIASGSLTGTQPAINVTRAVMPGLFEKPAPWNKDVSLMTPSSRSASIIAALEAMGGWNIGTPGSPVTKLQVDFSIPLMFANGATPRRTITAPLDGYCYGGPDCDTVPLQMPLPLNGYTEGNLTYTCPRANEDCHVLVVETQEKKLYELYNATDVNGTSFIALGAFTWDLTKQYTEVLRGDQCTSADAAGLPIAALLPTADEVAAGEVPHALRFILRNQKMKKGGFANGVFVRPATHAGGPLNTTNPDAPPYGVRFRLKASFDETLYSAGARVILRALKKYGMILSDGGNIPLTFADDRLSTNKWADPAIDITSHSFTNMPVTAFDVVDLGPEIVNTYNCVRAP